MMIKETCLHLGGCWESLGVVLSLLWSLDQEPHLDISVGNVLAVQELDGGADIPHDLCSFCRHRGGAVVRGKGWAPGVSTHVASDHAPRTTQDGDSSPATQDTHPLHPTPIILIPSGDAPTHLDFFPQAWAISSQLRCWLAPRGFEASIPRPWTVHL